MEDGNDSFYVVRKGDTIGVYKSLSDVQSALQSSGGDLSVSVSKGYGLSKEAEEYLSSHGLKNPIYSLDSSLVQDDLFGKLITCLNQDPSSSNNKPSDKNHIEKMQQDVVGYFGSASLAKSPPLKRSKANNFLEAPQFFYYDVSQDVGGCSRSASFAQTPQLKNTQVDNALEASQSSSSCASCVIEFDGASKGNPGPAGAGAVIRSADGSMVFRLCEGVGIATNNVAEYRGAILGLKYALQKGFKHVRVQGDSKLVCMQVKGLWKVKNENMAELCKVAKELKNQFLSFQISHVDRDFNADADTQANQGVHLKDGEVKVVCGTK